MRLGSWRRSSCHHARARGKSLGDIERDHRQSVVMGTDIHGAIECRQVFSYPPQDASRKGWEFAMDLDCLYDARDYDAFGRLFGVTNFAGFDPVAAGRGLPADADARTREQAAGILPPYFGMTWIGWEHLRRTAEQATDGTWEAGTEWLIGDRLYRSETLTRKDAIRPGSDWDRVWAVMSTLASAHGASNVRLVVWFDK